MKKTQKKTTKTPKKTIKKNPKRSSLTKELPCKLLVSEYDFSQVLNNLRRA